MYAIYEDRSLSVIQCEWLIQEFRAGNYKLENDQKPIWLKHGKVIL